MAYVRKTRDEFEIQSNYGYGWDVECTEETMRQARLQARRYRENISAPVRIVKRRVSLTETEG